MTLAEARRLLKYGESCDVAEALVWALSQLEWRPIETAPKGGTKILLAFTPDGDELGMMIASCWAGDPDVPDTGYWQCYDSAEEEHQVSFDRATHWRPLGPGPEGKS